MRHVLCPPLWVWVIWVWDIMLGKRVQKCAHKKAAGATSSIAHFAECSRVDVITKGHIGLRIKLWWMKMLGCVCNQCVVL